jgi:hypothetical protein
MLVDYLLYLQSSQIFAHLGPADLLHLCRTNKAFRRVLLSRSSAFVWREVLDAVKPDEYPPCPEDMSPPAWVGLVWGGPWCAVCSLSTCACLRHSDRLHRRAVPRLSKHFGILDAVFARPARTLGTVYVCLDQHTAKLRF